MEREQGGLRQVIAMTIGIIAVFVTSTIEWRVPGALGTSTALAINGATGALAARLLIPGGERLRAQIVAVLGGVLAALGAYAVTIWWLDKRSSVSSYEILVCCIVGVLPGWLLGSVGFARLRRPDEPIPAARTVSRHRE